MILTEAQGRICRAAGNLAKAKVRPRCRNVYFIFSFATGSRLNTPGSLPSRMGDLVQGLSRASPTSLSEN